MTQKPDYHQHEEFQNRTRKLTEIRQAKLDPYPPKYSPTHHSKELHEQYEKVEIGHSDQAGEGSTPKVSVSGRLVLFRSMGKNAFGQIQDDQGRIQIMLNRDLTQLTGYEPQSEMVEQISDYRFIEKKIDLGDIIGVEGHLFHTNKGELTIYVKELTLLCKTLLPLAEKHAGLADKEIRYRKRWLDLISDREVAKLFRTRSHIIRMVRDYLDEYQFMEVETPILGSIYGGAEARPFTTVLNALDQNMFLRISLEIPLKKLIVGGMGRVYELGRVFRNEGIDRTHNPEFTMMEAYATNWDYLDMMKFVEELFERVALDLYGTTQVPYTLGEGAETIYINMKAPWTRLSMKESIKKYGNVDVDTLTDDQMRSRLIESGQIDPAEVKDFSRGLLIGALFEILVEHHLIQPHHIYDHPIETTPLCKPHRNSKLRAEGLVERFETFIIGKELCNSYSELNDPEIQRHLLEGQNDRRDAGDEEASPLDEEFLEAICQGMPPTGGIGIGIDRMVMILTNSHSIRDVLFFPWMK